MSNLKIVKTFSTASAIAGQRFVKLDSEGVVSLATDTAAPILGVTDLGRSDAGALGIALSGNGMQIELGAALSAGDYVTAGADGVAVAAVVGQHRAGRLLESGSTGDLVLYIPQDVVHSVNAV